jgi:hypothetical protein
VAPSTLLNGDLFIDGPDFLVKNGPRGNHLSTSSNSDSSNDNDENWSKSNSHSNNDNDNDNDENLYKLNVLLQFPNF